MESSFATPTTSPVIDYLRLLYETYAPLREGSVATYIPELAKADPEWFGICLVTAAGTVYEVGDSRRAFTLQSISKPFVYGLALEDHGRTDVLKRIGVEPTGDAFNSISLEPGSGRPRNPMINAGAIAATGLIQGKTAQTRLERIVEMLSLYAGRPLEIDETVFASENATGHRNRAIGHMLRNFDILADDPTPAVELYFRQCSVSVTCRDLGIMAGTLANRGVNPVTGQQAVRGAYVENILSVMGSCGMYDYAGEWIWRVGMPAKSGVSGGIIAVLPGQFGIGVYSPRLDARGNSVRGLRVCDDFSRHFDLHLFNRTVGAPSAIRLRFTGAEFTSCRARTAREAARLKAAGHAIRIVQLQGHIAFAAAERITQELLADLDGVRFVILDWKSVLSLSESAARLLHQVLVKLDAIRVDLLFTHTDTVPFLRRYLKLKLGTDLDEATRFPADNDRALEYCEEHLLAANGADTGNEPGPEPTPAEQAPTYELFATLSPDQLAVLRPRLVRRTWKSGETILREGSPAREIFFVARGRASVLVRNPDGRTRRLASFQDGMNFGEMAVLDGAARSADIVADTDIECDCLSLEVFEALRVERPDIKIRLLENLARDLSRRLRKANRELSVFA